MRRLPAVLPAAASALGQTPPVPLRAYCRRQTALWKAKRIAKALGGGAYLKARQGLLEKRG